MQAGAKSPHRTEKGDTDLRPNRISAQWLGVLMLPFVGALLAGCGNSIDGGAKASPDLSGYRFSVMGTAFLEKEATTRAYASGDIRLGGATFRVLRRTSSGVYAHYTGTTAADGSYSVAVDVPGGTGQDDLWEVEVFASGVRIPDADGRAVITNVLLLGALIPAPGVLLNRDANIASTLVAGNLEALHERGGKPAQMTQIELNALEQRAGSQVRTPAAGSTPVRLSAVSSQGSTPDAAHAQVVGSMAEHVVNVLNGVVSDVRVLQAGIAVTQVALVAGGGTSLVARPVDAAGNPAAAGVEFVIESGSGYVSLTPAGYNTVTVGALAAGSATILARVAIPGTIELVPRYKRVNVTVTASGASGQ